MALDDQLFTADGYLDAARLGDDLLSDGDLTRLHGSGARTQLLLDQLDRCTLLGADALLVAAGLGRMRHVLRGWSAVLARTVGRQNAADLIGVLAAPSGCYGDDSARAALDIESSLACRVGGQISQVRVGEGADDRFLVCWSGHLLRVVPSAPRGLPRV